MIASAAHCDVTNKAEVDALVNWTVQTYGAIDLLIANAGIVKGADFLDMTENDFDDVVRVNLKGVFLVSVLCPLELHANSKCQHWCVDAELQILLWITFYVSSFIQSLDLRHPLGSGMSSPKVRSCFGSQRINTLLQHPKRGQPCMHVICGLVVLQQFFALGCLCCPDHQRKQPQNVESQQFQNATAHHAMLHAL